MALVDGHRRFMWYNLRDYCKSINFIVIHLSTIYLKVFIKIFFCTGTLNDASIFNQTDFARKLYNNELQLPDSKALPNTNVKLPFSIVADEIFALHKNIMKPFANPNMSLEQQIFNYRGKRVRLSVECAFGVPCEKFQILNKNIDFNFQERRIVCAAVTLHNFLITRRLPVKPRKARINTNNAEINLNLSPVLQRICLSEYYSSPFGSVTWQLDCI